MASHHRTGAFSLIELLVVISIIALVIALAFPAINGARNVARRGETQAVMNEFSTACEQFRQDKDRLPGVFTPSQMGAAENEDFGFTAMENATLELMGGLVDTTSPTTEDKQFGPSNAARAENVALGRYVNEQLIGADTPGNPRYFVPRGKYWVAMERPRQQWGAGAALAATEANIPDLVDAWGNPFLLWVEDDAGPQQVETLNDFARINQSGNNTARFYWASNAGYLKATELGGRGRDQTIAVGSLLSDFRVAVERQRTMTALLGSPDFPAGDLDTTNMTDLLPASARASMFLQSAGADGIFLGSMDRGSRMTSAVDSGLYYGSHLLDRGNARHQEDGRQVTLDRITDFDDLTRPIGR